MIILEGPPPIDGAPIVAILNGATGRSSANRKTGAMAQLWIIRADISPVDAIHTGEDASVCAPSPLVGRPEPGRLLPTFALC